MARGSGVQPVFRAFFYEEPPIKYLHGGFSGLFHTGIAARALNIAGICSFAGAKAPR